MAKTNNLDPISDKVITMLSRKNEARERGLPLSREAIRHCANAIRAIHRAEFARAQTLLETAHIRIQEMKQTLSQHLDLRYGGFVFDAEKEYAEAQATMALVRGGPLPDPDELGVDYAAYVNGLGEAIGEMRRHLLDELRRGDPARIEELLSAVDDIYNLLISVDFPDAITSGLRRTTDVARGVLEKTRGDITLAFQQRSLERRLREIETNLGRITLPDATTLAHLVPERRAAPEAVAQEGTQPLEVAGTEAALARLETEAPPRRRRRPRPKAAAPPAELAQEPMPAVAAAEALAPAPEPVAAPKHRRRWRRRRPTTPPTPTEGALPTAAPALETPLEPTASPQEGAPEVAPKRRRRRRRRKAPSPAVEVALAPAGAEPMLGSPAPGESPSPPVSAPSPETPPRRRWWPLPLRHRSEGPGQPTSS